MKVIERKFDKDIIRLPILSMTTTELVALIENVGAKSREVELQIGETFDDHVTLETLDEISEHAAQISIPFSVRFDGVNLVFQNFECFITFDASEKIFAKSLENRLRSYQSWSSYILNRPVVLFVLAVAPAILAIEYMSAHLSPLDTILLSISGFFAFSFLSYKVLQKYYRPQIAHVERDGFWRRNSDKFILGIIMLLLGGVVSTLLS